MRLLKSSDTNSDAFCYWSFLPRSIRMHLHYHEERGVIMKDIMKELEERAQLDQQLYENLTKLLLNCPAGRIQLTTANGYPRYYWIKDGQRKYIRKQDLSLAKELMQKTYYKTLLQCLDEEQGALQSFLSHFKPDALAKTYETLHELKKQYVEPVILPDDQFARKWLEEMREKAALNRNNYPLPETFQTLNGEFVRSKSEKFILDLLKQFELPYVYEAPLILDDGIVYPDVTTLNMSARKTCYWEHFGMMDDPDYANEAIRKISRYERSGIFIGEQLIVTFESSKCPLGTMIIEQLIRKHLL